MYTWHSQCAKTLTSDFLQLEKAASDNAMVPRPVSIPLRPPELEPVSPTRWGRTRTRLLCRSPAVGAVTIFAPLASGAEDCGLWYSNIMCYALRSHQQQKHEHLPSVIHLTCQQNVAALSLHQELRAPIDSNPIMWAWPSYPATGCCSLVHRPTLHKHSLLAFMWLSSSNWTPW